MVGKLRVQAPCLLVGVGEVVAALQVAPVAVEAVAPVDQLDVRQRARAVALELVHDAVLIPEPGIVLVFGRVQLRLQPLRAGAACRQKSETSS